MPRSAATVSTATALVSVRWVVSGCSTDEWVATALIARVSAREYGVAAATLARAFPMREAAMSSIARKIFFSEFVDRIRPR